MVFCVTAALLFSVPPSHLGDLLGGSLETDVSLLNHDFSHMQRVALTANGNFQRILSSYHDAPVSVSVLKNEKREKGTYERRVNLRIGDRVCCVANSVVTCLSPNARDMVDSGSVGIGQLFTHLGELPHFSLLQASKDHLALRRVYTLTSKSVTCHIEEVMPETLFDYDFLQQSNEDFENEYGSFQQ